MKQGIQDQLSSNIAHHQNRVTWLSSDKPLYSCGTPVDAHTKINLLRQSKEFLKNPIATNDCQCDPRCE
jgi:hypothetical protein